MKNYSIRIVFVSQSLLHTLLPTSLIYPISVTAVIFTVTVRFIFVPLPNIVTALIINHSSDPVSLILVPITHVVNTLVFIQHDSLPGFDLNIFFAQKHSLILELSEKLFVELYFREGYFFQDFLYVWVLKKKQLLD
jgi:hypothetical protein